MAALTFAIPTFNRAAKVLRLLKQLDAELGAPGLSGVVDVLVSDNCSEDNTEALVTAFKPKTYSLKYVRQPRNLGFDGNIAFLYDNASSDYVWFFSDDDVLLPGAPGRVYEVLKKAKPDVLLFSFRQPPDSPHRTFKAAEPFEEIRAPREIIPLVGVCPKISIYVLRKTPFSAAQSAELTAFLGNGFYHIDLAYSILADSPSPKLCVIPDQLAACDAEFLKGVFDPGIILESYKLYAHPYVLEVMPEIIPAMRREAYLSYIDFLFAYKSGLLTATAPEAYERAIRTLQFRTIDLLSCPAKLVKTLLLRTGLVRVYTLLRRRTSPPRTKYEVE